MQAGVIQLFYDLLWMHNEITQIISPKFKIPNSVIYQCGTIKKWFFSNSRNEFLMKQVKSRSIEHLQEVFLKNCQFDIVAVYIRSEREDDQMTYHERNAFTSQQLNMDTVTEIVYLDKPQFITFIKEFDPTRNGLLQQFIPGGLYDTLIKAQWSPHVTLLTQSVSRLKLQDVQYSAQERCSMTPVYSRQTPVKVKELTYKIKVIAEYFQLKVSALTFEKYIPSRLTFYCKYINGDLYFLYATSCRTREYPSADHSNDVTPSNFKIIPSFNSRQPNVQIKDKICLNCNQICQKRDLTPITYDKLLSQPLESPTQMKVKIPDSEEDEMMRNEPLIPSIFRKLYPRMSGQEYQLLKSNYQFITKSIKVCEECYLGLVSPQKKIHTIIPKNYNNSILKLIKAVKQLQSTRGSQTCRAKPKLEKQKEQIETSPKLMSRLNLSTRARSVRSSRIMSGYSSTDAKKRLIFSSLGRRSSIEV